MGDCAIYRNVPSMRNPMGPEAILDRAYIQTSAHRRRFPVLWVPKTAARGGPIHEFVKVDVFLPGCPPSADTFTPRSPRLVNGGPLDISALTRSEHNESGARFMSQTITIDPEPPWKATAKSQSNSTARRGRERALPCHARRPGGSRPSAKARGVYREAQAEARHRRPGPREQRFTLTSVRHHLLVALLILLSTSCLFNA